MTATDVINYIRDYFTANNLVSLELTDDQIYNIAIKPTLSMLNQYIPAIRLKRFENIRVGGKDNFVYEFDYMVDGKVISVLRVVPSLTLYGLLGIGVLPAFINLPTLMNMYSNILNQQHFRHLNWQFIPPKTLIIMEPFYFEDATVVYTAEHEPDLSSVDNTFQWTVYKLALAHAKRTLGTARKKYSSFDTPFGQILVDIDIRMEGEEEIKTIEEELKSLTPMIPLIIA
ncbi:MAG: hypothetical protein QXW35_05485 [Candidatus Aenigmatarchaeota archaeon]